MPIALGPDEAAAYERNAEPGSFLAMLSTAGYRAAVAGIRLGVFAALRSGALPAGELAAAIDADERGTRLLCDLLTTAGYLALDGDRYANTPLATAWLADGAEGHALIDLFWQRVLFQVWDGIEESVRTGKPTIDFYAWLADHPETAAHFQTMLARHAGIICAEIADLIPVPDGPATLLDVGGGHAAYAIALCRLHARLRATVLDLPGALAAGAKAVTAAGMSDRIELRPGDHTTDDLGTGLDLVLLFNIMHGRDQAANKRLLSRVVGALRPGGVLAVLDLALQPPQGAGRSAAAFLHTFSFSLFHGEGGQVYGLDELTEMLGTAGLGPVATHRLATSPLHHLLVAKRP
jgi:SAM-dependent methyltransferase